MQSFIVGMQVCNSCYRWTLQRLQKKTSNSVFGGLLSRKMRTPNRPVFFQQIFFCAQENNNNHPTYEEFANLLKQGIFPWEQDDETQKRGNPQCSLCQGDFYIPCENCQGVGFLFIAEEDLWRTCEQCVGQGKNTCPVCSDSTKVDNDENDDWE